MVAVLGRFCSANLWNFQSLQRSWYTSQKKPSPSLGLWGILIQHIQPYYTRYWPSLVLDLANQVIWWPVEAQFLGARWSCWSASLAPRSRLHRGCTWGAPLVSFKIWSFFVDDGGTLNWDGHLHFDTYLSYRDISCVKWKDIDCWRPGIAHQSFGTAHHKIHVCKSQSEIVAKTRTSVAAQALFMLACAFPSWSRLLFVMGQGLQAGKTAGRLGWNVAGDETRGSK